MKKSFNLKFAAITIFFITVGQDNNFPTLLALLLFVISISLLVATEIFKQAKSVPVVLYEEVEEPEQEIRNFDKYTEDWLLNIWGDEN